MSARRQPATQRSPVLNIRASIPLNVTLRAECRRNGSYANRAVTFRMTRFYDTGNTHCGKLPFPYVSFVGIEFRT